MMVKKEKNRPGQQGFTLIEVMIVLVLIGIMGMFAAPEITKFRPNMQLKSAARDLYSNLQNAKMVAARESSMCAISFNVTIGGQLFDYVVYADAGDNLVYDTADDTVISQVQWADYDYVRLDTNKGSNAGFDFNDNSNGNPTVAFRPNGIPCMPEAGNPTNLVMLGSARRVYLLNTINSNAEVVIGISGNLSIEP